MHKTITEYRNLRNSFKPKEIKLIFLLESPPSSSAYFYDSNSLEHEWLFRAMMKIIGFEFNDLDKDIKETGLSRFKEAGYFHIDATYKPVNEINDSNHRNIAVMESFDELIKDLYELKCKEKNIPIILVKANIFALFNNCLKSKGYNVINENIVVPFPSHGQQNKFHQRINEIFTCQKIISDSKLKSHYLPYGIPSEYVENRQNTKAIILGADPSNFSNSGETVKVKTAFDLGGNDKRYFSSILNNIKEVGLDLNNIYVQNLVRNFMTEETAPNKLWNEFVQLWKPLLKEDLDILNRDRKTPVFVTAECILNVLLNDNIKKLPAKQYFEDNIIILPEHNYLNRILIPCFRRHYPYSNYPEYIKFIKKILNE